MILAIPGGRGFFSTLQTGFTHTDKHRIRIRQPMTDALADLHHLAVDLGSRPTRIGEIVPDLPIAIGTADASGTGMGGVWGSADPTLHPIAWRARFPLHTQAHWSVPPTRMAASRTPTSNWLAKSPDSTSSTNTTTAVNAPFAL